MDLIPARPCAGRGVVRAGRWGWLAAAPERLPGFVEETLRHGPAIDGWLRVTRRAVSVGGVTIPAGARCLPLIGAVNRDPAVFREPDRFDPTRVAARDLFPSTTVRISVPGHAGPVGGQDRAGAPRRGHSQAAAGGRPRHRLQTQSRLPCAPGVAGGCRCRWRADVTARGGAGDVANRPDRLTLHPAEGPGTGPDQ